MRNEENPTKGQKRRSDWELRRWALRRCEGTTVRLNDSAIMRMSENKENLC